MASFARVGVSHKTAGESRALSRLDEAEVERICLSGGFHFRDVKLPPGRTVKHFAWQVLMGNVSCDAVAHHAAGTFTASAYCQARRRLPRAVLQEVSDGIAAEALSAAGSGSRHDWLGHRTFRIDGSGTRLPDAKEVRDHFGCSGNCRPGCSYPTAHLLLLVGAGGVGLDVICSPLRTGDMTHAGKMHRHLKSGDVLIGDGLFGSCCHLHALTSQQLHGVFPVHHSRTIAWGPNADQGPNRRFVKSLGWRDQLVEYRKPDKRPAWMNEKEFKSAPRWIRVREVQRQVMIGGVRRAITLVTTLTESRTYPARALVKLLGERWTIEVNLRSLKTTMGAERLHCQSVDGVKKELLMYLIVYNLVRLLMLEAASRQRVPFDRLSFADALARLRYGTEPEIWVDLKINPLRPGRIEPRVVKRRPKPYATMGRPRNVMRRQLLLLRKRAAA